MKSWRDIHIQRRQLSADPEKAFVLDMGEKSETALEYPELVEIMRKLLTNTAEGYTDIDQVIEDYQQFLEAVDTQCTEITF